MIQLKLPNITICPFLNDTISPETIDCMIYEICSSEKCKNCENKENILKKGKKENGIN